MLLNKKIINIHVNFIILILLITFQISCSGLVASLNDSSTGSSSASSELAPSNDDGESLQALLPVIVAAQGLVQNSASTSTSISALYNPIELFGSIPSDSDVRYAIGTWNTGDDFPATPQEMWDDVTFRASDATVARYPATGYIEDFYGVQGYRAYMELRQSSDNWGAFQVSLYVYQTLSTVARYQLEQYRLPTDDWTFYVDENTGTYNPIAFENIKTFYFDSRVETRELQWTRYVDSKVYEKSYFARPEDFSASEYTYPDTIVEPSKIDATDLDDGTEEFAEHNTISVNDDDCVTANQNDDASDDNSSDDGGSDSLCGTITGVEYYTILLNDNNERETFSKTYYTTTYADNDDDSDDSDSSDDSSSGDGDNEEDSMVSKTVIIYKVDANSDKVVKTKTVQEQQVGNTESTITITESATTNDSDGDGKANYILTTSSDTVEVKNSKIKTFNTTTVLDIEETTAGSNSYAGTMVVTTSKKTTNYTVVLDFSTGITLTKVSETNLLKKATTDDDVLNEISFSFSSLSHLDASSNNSSVEITLSNGTFDAKMNGSFLEGKFTHTDGSTGKLQIGNGFMIFYSK
ncbi:hypothetical protein BVY03_04170 [bacterium K02(2017)]|nr:hypothetical protein BVY03_04170 [bacterium K02(2017)]